MLLSLVMKQRWACDMNSVYASHGGHVTLESGTRVAAARRARFNLIQYQQRLWLRLATENKTVASLACIRRSV